jgi:hypothetical protein
MLRGPRRRIADLDLEPRAIRLWNMSDWRRARRRRPNRAAAIDGVNELLIVASASRVIADVLAG